MISRLLYNNGLIDESMIAASSMAAGLVHSAVKSGTGSAVITITGDYTGGSDKLYVCQIDSVSGGVNVGQATFKWSQDGGTTWTATGVTTSTTFIDLDNGVQIKWTAGAGDDFAVGDRFGFWATAPFGIAKALDDGRNTRFRSGGTALDLTIDLGAAKTIKGLSLYDHNLTSAATISAKSIADNPVWQQNTVTGNTYLTAIAWNGTVFCAIAYGSTISSTSPDGITWTSHNTMPSGDWAAIAWNGIVFCAIAYGTLAATSPDGITWTARTLPSSKNWLAIAWNGTVFCAVSSSNTAATSPDGITWTARTLPASKTWFSIAWNGTVFCVLSANPSAACATSPDGITWTSRTVPAKNWRAIAWNGTVFCIVASGSNDAATSPDGITWTARTMSSSQAWNSIAWNGTIFCAIAASSNVSATSPDGITWSEKAMPSSSTWYAIVWGSGSFCAITNMSSHLAATLSIYPYTLTITWHADKIIYYLSAIQTYKNWLISIADPANPSGYIEFSHLLLAQDYLEFSRPYVYGNDNGIEMLQAANEDRYGVQASRFYNLKKQLGCKFNRLQDTDIAAIEMMMETINDQATGRSAAVIWTPDTTAPSTSYLVTLKDMPTRNVAHNRHELDFNPQEVLRSVIG